MTCCFRRREGWQENVLTDACFFLAQVYFPSTGNTNNCDGGRSHTYCDYRQQ